MYNDIAITVTLLNRGLCEGVYRLLPVAPFAI